MLYGLPVVLFPLFFFFFFGLPRLYRKYLFLSTRRQGYLHGVIGEHWFSKFFDYFAHSVQV